VIAACSQASYYWATAAAVVGVAWALAFCWWAFLRHGGTIG
jgi:hypothetical protein